MKDLIEVTDRKFSPPRKTWLNLRAVSCIEQLSDRGDSYDVMMWGGHITVSREDVSRILAALEQL